MSRDPLMDCRAQLPASRLGLGLGQGDCYLIANVASPGRLPSAAAEGTGASEWGASLGKGKISPLSPHFCKMPLRCFSSGSFVFPFVCVLREQVFSEVLQSAWPDPRS